MIIDKQKIKRQALLVPCKTKEALRNWLKVYLKFDVFDCIVSRYATACPLDAAWELYKFGLNPQTHQPHRWLFAAGRSTQKTISLAAIETALVLHTRRNVIHFAGSKDQVDTAYSYMKQFFNRPFIRDLIKGDVKSTETIFLIPDYKNELWLKGNSGPQIQELNPDAVRTVNVKVLPITPFTVQSKHESIVSTDEIHTLKGEKAYAYKDIRKIPCASWDGKPWIRAGISSRKSPDSIVEMEIADKEKTGLIVKNWTVLEGVQRCPDIRSGTDFEHIRMVNVYDGKEKTEDEFKSYDGKDKDKYEKVTFASGCLKCPIRSICMTDLKKQTCTSKHLQNVEAAIVDYLSDNDRGWYLAQCMSMQPSKEGLVFARYDEDVHHIDADAMYEIFTGKKPEYPQNLSSLIQLFRMKGLKCYAGLDWGYTDPFAISIIFTDGERAFVAYSFAKSGLEVEKDIVPFLRTLQAQFGNFRIFPDTARPDNNAALIGHGFDVFIDFTKKIDTGITKIRSFLAPMAGPPKLYLLKGHNDPLKDEMRKYHRIMNLDGTPSEEIADEFNHNVDALRYFFLNVFGDGPDVIMSVETDDTKLGMSGIPSFQPSPYTYTTPLPDTKPKPTTGGSSGGFMWDFGSSEE